MFIRYKTNRCLQRFVVIHDKTNEPHGFAGGAPNVLGTYQILTVGYWPTVSMTGNGELGFDSGEGA